jgi:hypothetical protein
MLLEAGDDLQSLCLDADVFYVDKQLDKALVDVRAERSASAQEPLIRIRSSTPVEGPVVTVHLRAGCVQKTSRRYVVLAVAPKARPASQSSDLLPTPAQSANPGATPVTAAMPQDAEKAQLEASLLRAREELEKNKAALAENRTQLEKAETSRMVKFLLYGLLGLLTLGGLFFLSRQRQEDSTQRAELRPAPAPAVSGSSVELDLDVDESLFDDLRRSSRRTAPESIPPLPRQDRAKFSVSVPFVQRTVKVPELFDLQQQVEFFSSLGQQDRAVALLRGHLVDNVKTSALVYLDLLDLYHQMGNEEDFEVLRADFNRVFNTQIASFDDYVNDRQPAPMYEAVLARVQRAWGSRRVLEVLEDALFREPGNPAEVMHLEGYRELLLLHAVAREITELEIGPSGTGDTLWPDIAMQPRSSPRLGLDIDLTQFASGAETARSLPDSRSADSRGIARRESGHRGGSSTSDSSLPAETTALDSLVDFDDYDTGFRPDGFGRPARS